MSPAQVMRDLARLFIGSPNGKVPNVCFNGSQYICDLLGEPGVVAGADYETQEDALSYLQKLGMGSGFFAFLIEGEDSDAIDTRELARRRAAWLLFAADRWDEGVR